jgi:signal transduction histidine kinase/CheY-like chemotaxis protein
MDMVRRARLPIAAAVAFPLLIFLGFQIAYTQREEHRSFETEALANAERLSTEADAELSRSLGSLDALATVRAFSQGDLALAYARAREIAALNPQWVSVVATDLRTGRALFDLRKPFGAPLGISPYRLEGARPVPPGAFAGDVAGTGPGCPCPLVHRVIRLAGKPALLLTALLDPMPFQRRVLANADVHRVVGLVDSRGNFIARNINFRQRLGKPASVYLRDAIQTRDRGSYNGTTLEGFVNYTGFVKSPLTGWSAHVAYDRSLVDAPRRRALAAAALAALFSLLLAASLIWFTLRQLAQERRVQLRLQEAQKMEALGQLTGGIAHDFNNLLTPIVGGLDLLTRRSGLDDRSKRLAEGALASARKAAKLTKQLLAFSRRQRLELGPIDLPRLVEELRPLLQQSVGAAVHIEIELDPEAGCVLSDSNQLELALLNLAVNARDAMAQGGVLAIRSKALRPGKEGDRAMVAVTVSDTGAGMTPDILRRATEPFFTTKPSGSGTGLGLAQVYALAQQSGGSLAIDSEAGEGTRVTLILPTCNLPPPAERPAGALSAVEPASKRVLVCDDDDAVRNFVGRTLDDAGYVVEMVGDGRTAIEALLHAQTDLLVVDFAMDGINGAEVARAVREKYPHMALLMITGYLDSEAVDAAGVDVPVLRKPFDGETLIEAVRSALGSASERGEG